MIFPMCFFLLFSQSFTLTFLFLNSSTAVGFSEDAIIIKYWAIVQVSEGRQLINHCLTIVLHFLCEAVTLLINNRDIGHLLPYFRQHILILNKVIRNINTGKRGTFYEASDIIESSELTDTVTF